MKKIIHHIRRQPEKVRRHILHVSILACGAVLVSLWIYTLGTNFASPDTQAKFSQDLKPFSALKDNMIGGYNSLSQQSPATGQQ
jgi:hypothetical protein